jgi:hypothetical protein
VVVVGTKGAEGAGSEAVVVGLGEAITAVGVVLVGRAGVAVVLVDVGATVTVPLFVIDEVALRRVRS